MIGSKTFIVESVCLGNKKKGTRTSEEYEVLAALKWKESAWGRGLPGRLWVKVTYWSSELEEKETAPGEPN